MDKFHAMRMLSKAPWTESMASADVRQSALVVISRSWFVKNVGTIKHPFARAELALAAGVYEGLITPTLPDDTTVALRTIIDHFTTCNGMFSRAEVTCPFSHAKSNGVVIKRKQGNTPPKRGRAVTFLTAFRRQCVQEDVTEMITTLKSSSLMKTGSPPIP